MVPLANIDMHEMSACRAAKPASSRNKKMPPGRTSSSVSSGGSSSTEDRKRREAARLAACKAQAQAVGKVEDCRAVDFAQDAYAAFRLPPSTAFDGNTYTEDKDYVAVARAAGLIEDGGFPTSDDSSLEELDIITQYQNACKQAEGATAVGTKQVDCCDDKDYAVYKKKQHHAYTKHSSATRHATGRIENGVVVERPYVPHVITIDDVSVASGGPWTCPQCAVDNGSQRSECAGCRFSNMDPDALEQLADLPRDATGYYKRFSAAFNVTCGIAVGSAVGGATSVFRGRSVADGLIEGAMTGVVGGGLVAILR
jgi:hypothetical protein